MILDEAIRHAKEVTDEKKKEACDLYDTKNYEESRECIWCAEEHRQLAEWLKELKQFRENNHMSMKKSNEFLLRMRKEKGITRKELSLISGISVRTIEGWEQGRHEMTLSNADKVFKALGISVTIGATES